MTPKQSACLDYVKGYIAANGFSPTYEEIKTALGLASKSGVSRLLDELVRSGKVRLGFQRARSVEIVTAADESLIAAARLVIEKHRAGRLQPAHIDQLARAVGEVR